MKKLDLHCSIAAALLLSLLGATTACGSPSAGETASNGEVTSVAPDNNTSDRANSASPPPPTPTTSEGVEAEPDRPDLVEFPHCEQILTLDEAKSIMNSEATLFHGEAPGAEALTQDSRLGPAAQTAFANSTRVITCTWYIPNSDGFLHFILAETPESDRDSFMAALRASDYTETSAVGGSSVFEYDDGVRGISVGTMRFAFVGEWLMHTQVPTDIVPAVTAELERL